MTDSTNPDGGNGNAGPDGSNPSTDKTVENAEQMGGGYGGPFPVNPEEEEVSGGGASSEADSSDDSSEAAPGAE